MRAGHGPPARPPGPRSVSVVHRGTSVVGGGPARPARVGQECACRAVPARAFGGIRCGCSRS
ncbi:hypothetical protein Ae406Ps2_5877 [Pseudonocardia sp. Ae406_Ps2]|nr:hypothetical protein Ae406Ps2_5877 [Pseudonocardia sp. Ae406_Ps2]OLM27455.1 hypothetical protein Ae706Ps2_5889 [Pseudonocardia sp. Ae706_Ps2]